MPHEEVPDFTWQENKAYADIICYGLNQMDIEVLQFMADNLMLEDDE